MKTHGFSSTCTYACEQGLCTVLIHFYIYILTTAQCTCQQLWGILSTDSVPGMPAMPSMPLSLTGLPSCSSKSTLELLDQQRGQGGEEGPGGELKGRVTS